MEKYYHFIIEHSTINHQSRSTSFTKFSYQNHRHEDFYPLCCHCW